MSAPISISNLNALTRPHVSRGWFVYLDLPSGEHRLHTGIGTINLGGHDWKGIVDPVGGTLASISAVDEPRFGTAAVVQLGLTGVTDEFYKSVFDQADAIEGRSAEVYFMVVDQETGETLLPFKRYMKGFLSSPKHRETARNTRSIAANIENIWFRANQPFRGKWNDPSQQKLFPGDRGLQYTGYSGSELTK